MLARGRVLIRMRPGPRRPADSGTRPRSADDKGVDDKGVDVVPGILAVPAAGRVAGS